MNAPTGMTLSYEPYDGGGLGKSRPAAENTAAANGRRSAEAMARCRAKGRGAAASRAGVRKGYLDGDGD